VQPEPDGIAKAFIIGEKFIDGQACALILGDNVYYGAGLGEMVQRAAARGEGATVFCHWVSNPSRYGVLDFDAENQPIRIEEKPKQPKSNWAVTGLYFYDPSIVEVAHKLKPSARGELEITDANRVYLDAGRLSVEKLGRGFAWFDAGTHHSLLQASEFIYTIEERQGLKIGCPEEIAYRMGYIDDVVLERLAAAITNSEYSGYLRRLPTTNA
jgi:glucose-1-phosphate thymidylyltransferase